MSRFAFEDAWNARGYFVAIGVCTPTGSRRLKARKHACAAVCRYVICTSLTRCFLLILRTSCMLTKTYATSSMLHLQQQSEKPSIPIDSACQSLTPKTTTEEKEKKIQVFNPSSPSFDFPSPSSNVHQSTSNRNNQKAERRRYGCLGSYLPIATICTST